MELEVLNPCELRDTYMEIRNSFNETISLEPMVTSIRARTTVNQLMPIPVDTVCDMGTYDEVLLANTTCCGTRNLYFLNDDESLLTVST